ncbi:sugar ABC transporter substrate-binding protein [Jeotgalibacillus salarius]|uniref:Sugar ABC transporter substrate-binding protein n=1 Tax=Jeotgalibacillus salarius TaxID=546023 RepID=A0A4Y8LLG1_9BACL|nr:substrate-binding domain-containing protein [Jeotgalibacillus salarius]TFE01555.1 sugar ABC transporter substrate-binding protein [Jeotgalibacillus salarius]
MRKLFTLMVAVVGIFLFYFTFQAAAAVFYTDWDLPNSSEQDEGVPRIVLIMNEIDHPFWRGVTSGAEEKAVEMDIDLDVSGIYGNNTDDFLRKIEIAIYSKVDGIIVQGLDHEKFKELTKLKAASYGIPVLTVAHDVPKEESLRKTYVGSDQFEAGELLAEQLLKDMGKAGEVILMIDSEQAYFQRQRLEGIEHYLADYPDISVIEAKIGAESDQGLSSVNDLLNHFPQAASFVAVNASYTEELVKEIETRRKVEPYYIYTFDEERGAYALLEDGKIDGIVEQSPKEMGRLSVELMSEWLQKDSLPLDIEGYFTDIQIVKDLSGQ